jgi:hypothetical protein
MPTVTASPQDAAQLWLMWAAAGRHLSRVLASQGSEFDAALKSARAATYDRAAVLLHANSDPQEAAKLMMKHVAESYVRTPPLIGFDQAAIRYTVARTWQRCALMLDPSLDEVQPRWPEG